MIRRSAPGWIRRLLPWLRPHRRNVILAFGAALAGGAISAALPAIERQIIDRVIIRRDEPLWPWLTLMAVLAVATFVFSHIRRYIGGRVSLDVQFDLRNAIFDQLQRLDAALHDEMQTGQLVSRANSDVGLLQGLLGFLPMMTGNLLLMVSSLVIMFLYSPLLALISLAVVPALVVTAYRMRLRTFPANWDAQQKEGEVAVVVEEAVTGVRVVKGFGQERRELQRLVERAESLFASRMRAVRLQARFQPVLSGLPVLGQVGVLALGGWMAMHHRISLGTFLAFATYLLQMASPARMLAGLLIVGQQARAGAQRVLDLLAANPVVTEKPDAVDVPADPGRIAFRSVTFGYSRISPVLQGFDLEVESGETVALVGASGSGKSTVALLLPRFYDVHDGAVTVGGVDVRDVTLASLRSRIGVVFEESFLFSESVRDNIAYARPDATDAEVEEAARAAEAHRFITELPAGYATVVGERGLTLSGGQRQRIALARALLSDPRILILDDATSAIDAKVEADIQVTLRRVMRGRTTLLVAHRRSTLRLADRIAVVEGGRVVDHGTHDELMARCSLYRRLLGGSGEEIDALDGWAGELDEHDDGPSAGGSPVGISPQLWPYDRLDETPLTIGSGVAGAQNGRASLGAGLRGMGGGSGSGGGGSGGGGGWMGAVGPTPELLEAVGALPPAGDRPRVDVAAEAAYDPSFSLRRFTRPFRWSLAAGLTLVILDALAGLSGPLLIRDGLDRGVARGSGGALWVASLAFLAVALADWADSTLQVMVTGRTAERMLFALRVRIWAHLQRLSLDFYEREMGGRILTRMTTDVDALSNLLNSGLINAVVSLFTIVGVGAAMLVWNAELALVSLSVVVPLAFATAAYRRRSAQAYAKARERIAVVNANMQENLSGVRESQAFRREDRNRLEFRRLAGGYLDARVSAQRLVALYFPFVEFLADVAAVLVLGVGSVLIARRSLTSGELIGFILYLDLFFSPIQQLSQTFDAYQQAGASMAQIDSLMEVPPLVVEADCPQSPGPLRGSIRLAAVSFAYPGAGADRLALRHLDLEIPAGQAVALVGETGAGKSTVLKLLTRFYDPLEGVVSVDGHDLRSLDLAAYRHRLGYVPQEAHLFSGTIRDNIGYGRPDATDTEIEAAARAVGAHEVIAALSDGYLHRVTERGRSLSVGQRQLIALARAQLVDPAILLLDEATSNLDLATEAKVSQAMGLLAAGRTTVLIAHRLQTARLADRIVVLDAGRVVEDGTHDTLVAMAGRYAEMWAAFADGQAAGDVPAASAGEAPAEGVARR